MAHKCPHCKASCDCRGDIDTRSFGTAREKYCLHECDDEFDYEATLLDEDDY